MTDAALLERPAITALLLAGGRGSRMGGVDKGLQHFHGRPLALNALLRLQQQTLPPTRVMINANRNLAAYEAFGVPVWPDALADYAGPLAGFLTGLERCEAPLLLTLPCDVPNFPLSLCERLANALLGQEAEIAMVSAPEIDDAGQTRLRPQPVFCLLRAELLEEGTAQEAEITPQDLAKGEIFVGNSLRGLIRARLAGDVA